MQVRTKRRIWSAVPLLCALSLAAPPALAHEHASPVRSLAYSGDGKLLVSGDDAGVVRLWNVGKRKLKPARTVGRLTGTGLEAVALSHDGKRVAASSDSGHVILWDARGSVLRTLKSEGGAVHSLVFSPDGRHLASAHANGIAALWEVKGGSLVHRFACGAGACRAVAFSADGRLLVAGGADGVLRTFDLKGRTLRASLTGHTGSIESVMTLPGGSRVVSAATDDSVRVWDLSRGETVRVLSLERAPLSLDCSGDGATLAIGNAHGVAVYDTASWSVVRRLGSGGASSFHALAVSPDGRNVVEGGSDNALRLWSGDSGALLEER